ncbi:MAG: hypothetical protein FWG20_04045 [Candidatus Cloacimonetes bacterium]|nr:hypothetical protein [Candidatus Cloacimonadota bacterium]
MMYAAASSSLINSYSSIPGALALKMKDWLLWGTDIEPALQGLVSTRGRLNAHNAVLNVISEAVLITSDIEIPADTILDKIYIVDNDAIVTVLGDITGADAQNYQYGFFYRKGKLRYPYSGIKVDNIMLNGFGSGFEFILEDSTRTHFDTHFTRSKIELNATECLSQSNVLWEFTNSSISLSNRSGFIFTNSSITLSDSTSIIGYQDSNGLIWTDPEYLEGDRLVFNNSILRMDELTCVSSGMNEITFDEDEEMNKNWDGIYIFDSRGDEDFESEDCVRLSGDISGIENLVLSNSVVLIENATIHDMGALYIVEDSRVLIRNSTFTNMSVEVSSDSEIIDSEACFETVSFTVQNEAVLTLNSTSFEFNNSTFAVSGNGELLSENSEIKLLNQSNLSVNNATFILCASTLELNECSTVNISNQSIFYSSRFDTNHWKHRYYRPAAWR